MRLRRVKVFRQMRLVVKVLDTSRSRLTAFVHARLGVVAPRVQSRFWGLFVSGTSGPGHDLTAPCALDLCVTEYGISPVLGRSENKLRDDDDDEEEEERVHYFCFQYGIRSGSCLQRKKRQNTKNKGKILLVKIRSIKYKKT